MARMDDLTPRVLPLSRGASLASWLPYLLLCAVIVAKGVSGGLDGALGVAAVIGLLGTVVGAVAILRPPALVVDADGLALRTPVRHQWVHRWTDCGPFRVWKDDVVVWTNPAEASRRTRRAAKWRARADADTGVIARFGGLTAPDLAALLNRYREAAGSGSEA